MFLQVIDAKYIDNYQIWLKFNDDTDGFIDFADKIDGEIFEPLKDKDYFSHFFVDGYTINWENGADFAPEYLKDLLMNKVT